MPGADHLCLKGSGMALRANWPSLTQELIKLCCLLALLVGCAALCFFSCLSNDYNGVLM